VNCTDSSLISFCGGKFSIHFPYHERLSFVSVNKIYTLCLEIISKHGLENGAVKMKGSVFFPLNKNLGD